MASESTAPYRLTLLGPWDLRGPDGKKVRSVLAQPKRLCLLAYLALEGEPVARSTLVALFWPDRDEDRARNALSQSLHYLRRSLGPNVVESVEGDRVWVAPGALFFDARALMNGTVTGDASGASTGPGMGGPATNGDTPGRGAGSREASPGERAAVSPLVELARPVLRGRDFFQGWNADGSRPLQDWLDDVRRRVRERAETVAEAMALEGRGTSGETRGRASGETRSQGAPTPPDGGISRHPPNAKIVRRAAWVWGGVALGVLLTLGILRLGPGPPTPDGGIRADVPEVAVLFPRITIVGVPPTFSAEALAQAVHDELVVHLGSVQRIRPVFISFESEVFRLVRSLRAQGSEEVPDWVLSIRIRTAGDRARVVALLLRGPDYTYARITNAGDYAVPPGADALMELPRRIAVEMVAGVGDAVVGRGAGS